MVRVVCHEQPKTQPKVQESSKSIYPLAYATLTRELFDATLVLAGFLVSPTYFGYLAHFPHLSAYRILSSGKMCLFNVFI
jgi:hypothetical protein